MSDQPQRNRPRVFVGCSTEQLPVAKELQVLLDHTCEVELWNQGVFSAGGSTLSSLVRGARRFDFAVLVMNADDETTMREEQSRTTRDNVIFELGLFMGVLGPERTFMVEDRTARPRLPSDLAGVTRVDYEPHTNGNLTAALGAAATRLERAIAATGRITAQMRTEAMEHEQEQDAAASSAALDTPGGLRADREFVDELVSRWMQRRPEGRDAIKRVVQGLLDLGLALTPSSPRVGGGRSRSYLRVLRSDGKSAGYLESTGFSFVGTASLVEPEEVWAGKYPYILWTDKGAADLVLRVVKQWLEV